MGPFCARARTSPASSVSAMGPFTARSSMSPDSRSTEMGPLCVSTSRLVRAGTRIS